MTYNDIGAAPAQDDADQNLGTSSLRGGAV